MSDSFDRNKFRPTPLTVMKEKDRTDSEKAGIKNNITVPDYHKIEHGKNFFRIYPAHPSTDGKIQTFFEMKSGAYLPMLLPKFEKGEMVMENGAPVLEERKKFVFNALVHGPDGVKKDLIQEYIALANKIAKEHFTDEKKRKEFLEPFQYKKNVVGSGLMIDNKWIVYCDKIEGEKRTLGRLEFGMAVRQALNDIIRREDDGESTINVDPFTDPDDGRAIVIDYNSKAERPQDYYSVGLYAPLVKGGGGQIKLFPLTDEDLEEFMKYEPLSKMFRNVYTRRDFDFALQGITYFDNKFSLGIVETEEFLAIAEEISSWYPETGTADQSVNDVDDRASKPVSTPAPKVATSTPSASKPQGFAPKPGSPVDKKSQELTKEEEEIMNSPIEEKEEEIETVVSNNPSAVPFYSEETPVEEEEEEVPPVPSTPPPTKTTSAGMDRIAALKEKLAQKNK